MDSGCLPRGKGVWSCLLSVPFLRSGDPHGAEPRIQIFGNTHGLKASQVRAIERLHKRSLPADRLLTNEFARQLTEISREIRREVGVLVDRRGDVTHVMVGTSSAIEMPDWGRIRAGRGRLRGIRCIHTHLGGEGLTQDDLTDLVLLRFDAMVTVAVLEDGLPGLAHTAALRPDDGERDGLERGVEKLEPVHPAQLDLDFTGWIRDRENDLARSIRTQEVGDGERAILVSVTAGRSRAEFEAHVEELTELARSAGVELVDVVTQQRRRVDPKTVVGSGKLQDLMISSFQKGVDLVIFDQDLTPTQARNLSERMELRVIDRTQLILDIFAQRATSRDGKLQVELAQLKYRMPRLAQRDDLSLSRLEGGIGGRGPGESKLESDRRRVRDRAARLERELRKLGDQRKNRRRRRERREVPVLSIVGYTNAGKSTLLRALTNSDTKIEDKMFATLDPLSRRLRFPKEREVIVTDTVGFIRDLPKELVAAFQATLEELSDASLLMHVIDVASPELERRMAAVRQILDGLGLGDARELLVFNQADRLPAGEAAVIAERLGGVAVSALTGEGLVELLQRAEELMFGDDPAEGGLHAEARAAAGGLRIDRESIESR